MIVAYTAAIPFDQFQLPGLSISATPLFAVMLVITWAVGRRRISVANTGRSIFLCLVGVFWVWAALTLAWSNDVAATRLSLVQLGSVVLSLAALTCARRTTVLLMLRAFTISSSVVALALVAQGSVNELSGRMDLWGADENYMALATVQGLAAVMALRMLEPGRHFLLTAGCAPVLVMGALATGSRTGLAAMMAVISLSLLLGLRAPQFRGPRGLLGSALILCLPLVTGWMLSRSMANQRLVYFLQDPLADDSGRSVVQEMYLQSVGRWIIRGVGYGAQGTYLESQGWGSRQIVHNTAISVCVECGLVGLALIAGMLLTVLILGFRSGDLPAVTLVLLPPMVFMQSLSTLDINGVWLALAIPVALYSDRATSSRFPVGNRGRQSSLPKSPIVGHRLLPGSLAQPPSSSSSLPSASQLASRNGGR